MWIKADTIVHNALENRGQMDDSLRMMCLRWVEDCVKRIGIVPEYHQKADKVDITGNSIRKPKGLMSVRRMWVCDSDGNPTPTYYGGKQKRKIFDPDGCCDFYRMKNLGGILVMEDDLCFFSATQSLSSYSHAIIEYNGLIYDDDGHVLVPDVVGPAAEQFIEWRLTKREMKMNRAKIPRTEVDAEYDQWKEDAGIAYGRMKMPSVATLMERAEQKYHINLPAPRQRLR